MCVCVCVCVCVGGRMCRHLTTNEAGGLQHLFFFLFLASEVCKGVDDHTKDQVEDDDDDHEEEEQVVHHPGCKQGLLHTQNQRATIRQLCGIDRNNLNPFNITQTRTARDVTDGYTG